MSALEILQDEVIGCRRCPRLIEHCSATAKVKRRAFQEWTYWGKPVPSFGDPLASLLIIGLAPAAHGANRTGRVFTGDRSGDFLYRALHQTGFASQPDSRSIDDGLILRGAYISASVRCAPPANKPSQQEIESCRVYLEREIDLLTTVQVVVALGKLAFNNYLSILKSRGVIQSYVPFVFAHDREHKIAGHPLLISSYHPSQQNTSTGRLTEAMLRAVFLRARSRISAARQQPSLIMSE